MAFSAMSASESFSTRFPLKLWRLLNRCISGAICWAEHGRSIRIDRRRFEREYLMPADSAFKTSNFSSFVRQLNLYGFRKVINTFRFNQPTDSFREVDIHEYHHPFFRRGHPDLLNRVQRRMKGRKIPTGRPEMDAENTSLVSTLLKVKPVNHSTPKEQSRWDRPALHLMEMNAPGMRYPGLPLDNTAYTTATWSSCQSYPKPLAPAFLPALTASASAGSPLQRTGVEATLYSPSVIRPPQNLPNHYRIQHAHPTIHPSHQVVEAIQKVLGEKTLSEMVIPSTVSGDTLALYHSQPSPILPILNPLYAAQKTSSVPLNLPHNHASPVTTNTFSTPSYNRDPLCSLKTTPVPNILPLPRSPHFASLGRTIPTCTTVSEHVHSPVVGSGELAPVSQLSSLQDTVMSHLVNLCPPINEHVHPGTPFPKMASAQGHFSVPTSILHNSPVTHGSGMAGLVPTQIFYNVAQSSSMQNPPPPPPPPPTAATRGYVAIQSHPQAPSSTALPDLGQSPVLHNAATNPMLPDPQVVQPISALPNQPHPKGLLPTGPDFINGSSSPLLVHTPVASVCTETNQQVAETNQQVAETNQQVADSSQSPGATITVENEEGIRIEKINPGDLPKLAVNSESPSKVTYILHQEDITSPSGPAKTHSLIPAHREYTGSMPITPDVGFSSNMEFAGGSPAGSESTPVSGSQNSDMHQDAASFLRRLSQGGIDHTMNDNDENTDAASPVKQFQDEGKSSSREQDFFMPTIKLEMP